MAETRACRETVLLWVAMVGVCSFVMGVPMFGLSLDDLKNKQLIPVVAGVLEQHQTDGDCITLLSLTPDINVTAAVAEAWTCDFSSYMPRRPAPLCHKWKDIQDFSSTYWDRGSMQPSCVSFKGTWDTVIAGIVTTSFGLIAMVVSCCVVPLWTRMRSGRRVAAADNNNALAYGTV